MKHTRWFSALLILVVALPVMSAQTHQGKQVYPQAHRDRTVDTYFGTRVPAPYQWMEKLNSPQLKQWIDQENTLTQKYLKAIPQRNWIRQRLTRLWNYPREGVPVQAGDLLFYRHNSGLQNQSLLYVQVGSGKPRVLLDPNRLSKDGRVALLSWKPSDHGKYLAYGLSQGGSDWQTLHVMDVVTGKQLPDTIRWVKFSGISWTHDGQGFFYSRYPQPPQAKVIVDKVRIQSLYYHRLGTLQSADVLILRRRDLPEWVVGGEVSEDGRYLFVALAHGTSSRNLLYVADLGYGAQPDIGAQLQPLFTQDNAEYQPIGNIGKTVYMLTTLQAPRGRIVAFNIHHPIPQHWRVVVPQGRSVIRGATLADGRLLVNRLVDVKSEVSVYSTTGKPIGVLPTPAMGTIYGISARNSSRYVYYGYTSFLYPPAVFRYNIATAKGRALFKPEVSFDASKYVTKQVFYRSKDGTRIPMFLTYRKGLKLDGENPTLLYAYGGFDISITPRFSVTLPVWLEMGGVYAVANLRGGGEYGEAWHHAGMLGKKQNVFDDFAWAAKYLVRQHYTSAKHLGIEGYSNGGLLIGASITERPRLFGAAYAGHGVLDMLRYQKFSGGALWAPEYGTSNNKQAFKWLYAYSPLDNIKQGTCYPPTLITTSWDDDRVVPSHEFKFTAKIQRAQGCANPILLHVTGDTSHVYMPTDKQIAQTVDVWAFEAWNLGIKQAPALHGKPRD